MKRPFQLVKDTLSADTVECLRQLLTQAEKGDLLGLAFGGILRRRGYIVNSCGELRRNPTFARGVIAALDDELGQRARGDDDLEKEDS